MRYALLLAFAAAGCGKISEPPADSNTGDSAVVEAGTSDALPPCTGNESDQGVGAGEPICTYGACTRVGQTYCMTMPNSPKEYDCPQNTNSPLPGTCHTPGIDFAPDAQPPYRIYCCN